MNYTFITLDRDCRGPILYLIISAHEPQEVVMRLDATLERLISVKQKGFHPGTFKAFAFL